jgi:NDP-sugar pyrophosphorylase family protein
MIVNVFFEGGVFLSIRVADLLNLDQCRFRRIFDGVQYPWEVLARIKPYFKEFAAELPDDYEQIAENVWVGKGTTIERTVTIKGPAIIGHDCELRQSAFIREYVLIGNGAVIGNSTEIKNSIIFNKAQIPHFNYIGDSVLGYGAHLGAGVIVSNLKSNKDQVKVKDGNACIETGLRKFGAIVGDNAEVGCNSVLFPGTVIGRNSIVYPLTPVRGVVPENHILKNNGEIVPKK